MHIERGSGPKKCIRCLRTKEEAIREHIRTMRPCDNPECPFYNDIIVAIELERNRPKFKFGKPQKPNIKFGEIKKTKIKFGNPEQNDT